MTGFRNSKTWLVLLTFLSFLLGPGPSLNGQRLKSKTAEEAQSFAPTPPAQISEASQKLTASTSNVYRTFYTTPLPMLAWLLALCIIIHSTPSRQRKLYLRYGKLQLDGG